MTRGVILFAHGARDREWAEPFETLSARVRALAPGTPVRLAFLELMQPDLGTAAADLIAVGVDAIRIVPIFLGPGGHLRKDLPALVAVLEAKHAGVFFEPATPVGEDAAVLDAIAAFCVRGLGDR
jgi:sirohydrochlorin cobaltochelatase